MKKLISTILLVAIIFSSFAFPASAKEKVVDRKEYLYNHILAYEEKIDVSGLGYTVDNIDELLLDIRKLIFEDADLFYFEGITSYTYSGNDILSVSASYLYDYKQVKFVEEYANKNFLSKLNKKWSTLEKILYIHDKMATDFQYDVHLYDENGQSIVNRDIYKMFTDGYGVCQAYSQTFKYLMEKIGVECKYVASDDSNHEWNAVKVDGKWYHIDVTQDDPMMSISNNEISQLDRAGLVNHTYFLLSDSLLWDQHLDGDHYNWYYLDGSNITCDSDEFYYDYDFHAAVSAYVPVGDYWYFLEEDGELVEIEITRDFKEDNDFHSFSAKWDAESNNYYWKGCFSGLSGVGEWLIHNTSTKVYALNVETNEEIVLATLEDMQEADKTIPSNAHIYGSKLKDGKIYCQISLSPAAKKYYTAEVELCGETHRDVGDWVVLNEATHFEDGKRTKTCAFCDEVVEEEILPKSQHNVVRDAENDIKATCEENGKKAYKCTYDDCDYVEYRDGDKALGHIWSLDVKNSIPAGKTENGLRLEICLNKGCTSVKETVIPAFGEVSVGDCNGDNDINAADLALLKKGIAGLEIKSLLFDCNSDGGVDAADLAVLKKFIAKLISSLG